MAKKRIQTALIMVFAVLCFFSYKLGTKVRDYNINNKNTVTIHREIIQELSAGIEEQTSTDFLHGGNKGLIKEEFITGQKPLLHDSMLSEEMEHEILKQSEYVKNNFILEDDREDVIVSNDYSTGDTVEVINSTTKVMGKELQQVLNISNPNITVEAKSAVLMDSSTGELLFYKNPLERVYPASTVKIMTAMVALRYASSEDVIVVGEEINLMASDSSRAYLNEGEKLSLKMILEGLLLPSGNDAAYVIANYVGRIIASDDSLEIKESIQVFVNEMNQVAMELNLKDTYFVNPDGYDNENQYTTAYDMALMAKKALEYPLIGEIVHMEKARNIFLSGEDVTWNSGNKLITKGSSVYYPYAIGLKSGTSSLAGRCLVSAAKKEGTTYISVVMNTTAQGRWDDSLSLLKYGVDNK